MPFVSCHRTPKRARTPAVPWQAFERSASSGRAAGSCFLVPKLVLGNALLEAPASPSPRCKIQKYGIKGESPATPRPAPQRRGGWHFCATNAQNRVFPEEKAGVGIPKPIRRTADWLSLHVTVQVGARGTPRPHPRTPSPLAERGRIRGRTVPHLNGYHFTKRRCLVSRRTFISRCSHSPGGNMSTPASSSSAVRRIAACRDGVTPARYLPLEGWHTTHTVSAPRGSGSGRLADGAGTPARIGRKLTIAGLRLWER
jgi:hypothetical protein